MSAEEVDDGDDQPQCAETTIEVGAPGWPLPATLTIPAGAGPHPALVLVHGSGPQDRDGTNGRTALFRDLAFGLAGRGVLVLRYVKRTRQHPERFRRLRQYTIREESVDDALAAINALRRLPTVESVFLLGHSLGGYIAPRIAAEDGRLTGVVILAATSQHPASLFAQQVKEVASSKPELRLDAAALNQLDRQAKQAMDPNLSIALSGESMLLGLPAAYWKDVTAHPGPYLARQLTCPLLILQGDADRQVPPDNIDGWRSALRQRTDVTLGSYRKLNHAFAAADGGQSVASEVLDDIATWIHAKGG